MALEIERKFLLADCAFLDGLQGTYLVQGYIAGRERSAVRIRIKGERGYLTLKGPTRGVERSEFEYEIPCEEARAILDEFCDKPFIEKRRYEIEFAGNTWEVDVFCGENEGLKIAEIELEAVDQDFAKPPWLGREVSHDSRYFNSNLRKTPYRQWPLQ